MSSSQLSDSESVAQIHEVFVAQYHAAADLYQFLNQFRDWMNANVVNYEIFLEDNWFADKTTIEYTLRSLDTFNVVVVAEDEYENYRANNVWNLGPYVKTYWTVAEPWETMAAFMAENPSPRLHAIPEEPTPEQH